jgi:hypothetical protein
MPWHPCVNSRDSITQNDGIVINHVDYDDAGHTVTSYCRDINGTWVAWINAIVGDTTDPTSTNPDNVTNKAAWPARIESAVPITVAYFPDDGSDPVVYDLAVDPVFSWVAGTLPDFDPCSRVGGLGPQYSDAQKGALTAWFMDVLDVQVRTDGTNVWVVVLAREDVRYPYFGDCGLSLRDACGFEHPQIASFYESSPFVQDTDSGFTFWKHYHGFGGADGETDDNGLDNSFRWHAARVTVFGGDVGGFTRLDTVEAKFYNAGTHGLCGDIEACASPAEPGACHVMWSEGGTWDSFASQIGQRISYSRWDVTSKTVDTDLVFTTEDSDTELDHNGTRYNSDANWCWTGEYILRSDHGSPAAIMLPWPDINGPETVEYWDLSGGIANVVQTLSVDLYPTPVEGGFESPGSLSDGGLNATGLRRVHYASSLYTDPLLADTDVYLVCVGFNSAGLGGRAFAQVVYRIPCDGSATFDFIDGTRLSMFSILPNGAFVDDFRSDFVSDPGNIWVPATNENGGQVLHLPRTCTRTWELLPAFPTGITGVEIGDWRTAGTSPPTLIYDDAGDWLAGGGYGPTLPAVDAPTGIAAIRAKICRCCVPCIERIGLHIWETG